MHGTASLLQIQRGWAFLENEVTSCGQLFFLGQPKYSAGESCVWQSKMFYEFVKKAHWWRCDTLAGTAIQWAAGQTPLWGGDKPGIAHLMGCWQWLFFCPPNPFVVLSTYATKPLWNKILVLRKIIITGVMTQIFFSINSDLHCLNYFERKWQCLYFKNGQRLLYLIQLSKILYRILYCCAIKINNVNSYIFLKHSS